jgi:glutamine amidotransferase-like uncharacterized protein
MRLVPALCSAFVLLVPLTGPPEASAAPEAIRVAIYDHSSRTGHAGLRRLLSESAGFHTRVVRAEDICHDCLRDFDVLIMPGGSARSQANHLGAQGRAAVRRFVEHGGGYVGICAGSYLATPYYSWSLGLINARVVDRQHWARGTGKVTLALTADGQKALEHPDHQVRIYYGQGPLLAPAHYEGLTAYQTLARYTTAIARHGARASTMIGTTAIARSTYGNGRVICYSPHPEASGGPHHLLVAGVRWAANPNHATTRRPLLEAKSASSASSQPITPAGMQLARALDGMDVEHHWLPGVRVSWQSGKPTQPRQRAATHCSAFVAAACHRLGVYILRPPAHSQTLLANAQQRWLQTRGRDAGWRPVSSWQEAQQLANQGEIVVASYRNSNPHRPGHVALLRPSSRSAKSIEMDGPEVIWAGRHNCNSGTLLQGFRKHPKDEILFFSHRAEVLARKAG